MLQILLGAAVLLAVAWIAALWLSKPTPVTTIPAITVEGAKAVLLSQSQLTAAERGLCLESWGRALEEQCERHARAVVEGKTEPDVARHRIRQWIDARCERKEITEFVARMRREHQPSAPVARARLQSSTSGSRTSTSTTCPTHPTQSMAYAGADSRCDSGSTSSDSSCGGGGE